MAGAEIVVLYPVPHDADAFEQAYTREHSPMVTTQNFSGLTRPQPEHRLNDLLSREDSDSTHARYNALVRRLVSFERALECGAA